MSLCPLTEAHILQARVARLLEQARRPSEAYDADVLARHIEQIAAQRDAAEEARLTRSEAESDAWETTHGRAFDQAVRGMPTDQLMQILGA